MSNENSQKQPNISDAQSVIMPNNSDSGMQQSIPPDAHVNIKNSNDVKELTNKAKGTVQNPTVAGVKKQSLRPHSLAKSTPNAKAQTTSAGAKKLIKPVSKNKVRKTTLQISKIRPFTVFRMMLLLGMAVVVVLVVASLVLWFFMNATGVIDSVNKLIRETMSQQEQSFDIRGWLNPASLSGIMLVVGIVSAVLFAAVSAVGAMIYNVAVKIVGGVEVTLTDES